MERPGIAYVVTGLVAIVAGVAIAGLPSGGGDELTITAVPDSAPSTVVVTSTTPTTTTAATTTVAAPSTTTTSTTTTTTTDVVPPVADRAALRVTAANGTNVSGVAGAVATELEGLGYVGVGRGDTGPADVTIVYHLPGLEAEAERLAGDLDLDPTAIADAATAPEVAPAFDGQLLVVIGLDRVAP
jgi:LytR cell envelope-related transcriptional attenuator